MISDACINIIKHFILINLNFFFRISNLTYIGGVGSFMVASLIGKSLFKTERNGMHLLKKRFKKRSILLFYLYSNK